MVGDGGSSGGRMINKDTSSETQNNNAHREGLANVVCQV